MIPAEQYNENIIAYPAAEAAAQRTAEKDHQDNYYNNNYTHGAGRFLTPEQGEAIKTAYLENISDSIPGAVAHMIERAFASGLTADEIILAIEETAFAPRPSPWYLRRILETWAETGVTVSKIRHEVATNRALPWWK